MEEYKGIYYNDNGDDQPYYEGGAHFKYIDLYEILLKLEKRYNQRQQSANQQKVIINFISHIFPSQSKTRNNRPQLCQSSTSNSTTQAVLAYKTKQEFKSFNLKHQQILNQKIKHYSIKHNLGTILRNSSVNNNNNKEHRNVSDKKQNHINSDINTNTQNIKTSSINKNESVVNNNNTEIKNINNNNNKNLVKELSKKLIIPSALNKIENNNILTKRNRHISLDLNIISSSQNKHNNSTNKVTVNIKGRQNSLKKKVINGKKNSAAKNNINKNYSIKVQTIQSESNINHKHNNNSSFHIRNNTSSRTKTKYKKQISKDKKSSSKSICNDNNSKVSGNNKEIKATSITKLNFALLKQEYALKPQTNRKSRNIQHDNQLNGCYTERLKKSNVIPSNHYKTTINYKILNKPYNNSFSKLGNVDGVSHGNNNNIKKNCHNNNANKCSEVTNKVNFNLGRYKKTKSPP